MAQHFLLSKAAKTLSLASVFTMKDADAEMAFRRIRWANTNGEPVCPHCGGVDAYDCRRLKGGPRFRCRACVKDFTITSGTLFASHKLPLRCYLAAIALFCNEVKGKSALALSRESERFLQMRVCVAAQTPRGDGCGTKRPRDRRRGQGGRDRLRLFRRLRQTREPEKSSRRSPLLRTSIRQAQGSRGDPRAQWQHAAGSF